MLIDPETKRAYGVEMIRYKKRYHIYARKEVILSAGSLNSAQLLMLSGIGPASHLYEHGVSIQSTQAADPPPTSTNTA